MDSPIQTLRQTRGLLISDFLKYNSVDFMAHLSEILDEYFCGCIEQIQAVQPELMPKTAYAVVALGGYGRKEQCIHSDVDLMILYEHKIPEGAERFIRELLYPLWDIGLDVGHAVRALDECITMAGEDFEIFTSLLDARLICGDTELFEQMTRHLNKKVIRPRSSHIIRWLVERNQNRHQRFGDSSYLLEPNLKDGQGGLRDYHTVLWLAKIASGIRSAKGLETEGFMSHNEFNSLMEALSFIWLVRNNLHQLSGRVCNQLHFEFQIRIAEALDFKETDGHPPVDIFLGTLHEKMDLVKHEFLLFLYEQGYRPMTAMKRKAVHMTSDDGLKIQKNTLYFASPVKILHRPQLLLKIFEESARLNIPVSAEAIRQAREFSHLLNPSVVNSPEALKSFEYILETPVQTFNVLSEMLTAGLIQRIIPEFNSIVNRIQYDEYHLYPVDKHSLRTVKTIKQFGDPAAKPDALCARMYKELEHPGLLLWAALLHDIGKGATGGKHSVRGSVLVRPILNTKGFLKSDIDTVSFLIREHLTLIITATRRDINDEETAIHTARKIRDTERLKMLYLLTVADSMSTGPKAWNDWTASLLRSLFLKVLNILEKGELASSEAVKSVHRKKDAVLTAFTDLKQRQQVKDLLNFMSPRYLLYSNPESILDHIRLYNRLNADAFVWDVTPSEETHTRTVTVCARDFPGLFSKIAGVFTLNNLDILDVQVYTWRNNIALDIFKVKPPPDLIFEYERWERAEAHLRSVLAGKLDLSKAIEEKLTEYGAHIPFTSDRSHNVAIDNDSSNFFTIIEVFTFDFPGLLYRVTNALFECGLDVWVAKIATKVDQVVDVFYVRDFDGQKVDSAAQVDTIKSKIYNVLPDAGTVPDFSE